MKYDKSLAAIRAEIEDYTDTFKRLQEELIKTMVEIDKDIGFSLNNEDVEHATFLQHLFEELQEVANGANPLAYKQLTYILDLIREYTKEGENGEEHKATTEN